MNVAPDSQPDSQSGVSKLADGEGAGGPGERRVVRPVYELIVDSSAVRESSNFGVAPLEFDGATLLRWVVFSAVAVALAGALGFFLSGLKSEVYAARTEIFFPLDADRGTGFLREDRRISTQLEAIRSRAVLAPVAESSGLSVADLADRLSVGIVGASEIIRIEVRADNPDEALGLVSSVAETYRAQLNDPGVGAVRELLASEATGIAARQQEVEARLEEIEVASRSLTADEQLPAVLQQEVTLLLAEQVDLQGRAADLEQRVTDFEVTQALLPQPTVLAAPYALSDPVSPNRLVDAIVAMALGATLAAVIIVLLIIRNSGRRDGT